MNPITVNFNLTGASETIDSIIVNPKDFPKVINVLVPDPDSSHNIPNSTDVIGWWTISDKPDGEVFEGEIIISPQGEELNLTLQIARIDQNAENTRTELTVYINYPTKA